MQGHANLSIERLQHVNGGKAAVVGRLMQLESSCQTVRLNVLPPTLNLSHTLHVHLGGRNGSQRSHFWITSIAYMEIYDHYLSIRLPKRYVET